jgi:hypothetical protein
MIWRKMTFLVSVAVLFLESAPVTVLASDTNKVIAPMCSAEFDSADKRLILVVCDFSSLDPAQKITEATAYVDILDGDGRRLGSEKFQFVSKDDKRHLNGGKKYSRSFEYATKVAPTVTPILKMSRTEAVVEVQVAADQK